MLGQRGCAFVILTAALCRCCNDSSVGSSICACPPTPPHILPNMLLSKEAECTSFLELCREGRKARKKRGREDEIEVQVEGSNPRCMNRAQQFGSELEETGP